MIRSESTRVPPVTPERSPPASRITGALSPVIADSSTEATPSTISPSAGMTWPASTTTRSPVLSCGRGRPRPSRRLLEPIGERVLARGPQALRLGLAARLGQGLGEIGEEHRKQQQERQRRLVDDQAGGRAVDDRLDGDERRQHPADLDQEHDRVAPCSAGRA